MDACGPKSKHNGQQENDGIATEKSPTTITDLNDDCLIKCFNYLDFNSLIKVSDASVWLRPAANDVYKRKFGSKKHERIKTIFATSTLFGLIDGPFNDLLFEIER